MIFIFFLILFSASSFANIPVDHFLLDPESRVAPQFKISEYYYSSSLFWFEVYTKYDEKIQIIHDRHIPNLVYGIIDFSSLTKYELNSPSLVNSIATEKLNLIKKSLSEMSQNFKLNNAIKEKIIDSIKLASIDIPENQQKRSSFFKTLSQTIRLQSGQKNNIIKGLELYLPLEAYLHQLSSVYKLPHEIFALPFVESSFSFETTSKVGANGLWQIMPIIEKKMINSHANVDGTKSPILSTFAALHLIKSNYKILQSWDLTIAAYNSGAKHLMIAKDLFSGSPPLTLEKVLKFYKHPHLGFAAKNFFSEFLAMVHVLSYKEKIFPHIKMKQAPRYINTYINKCVTTKNKIFKLESGREYNLHLENLEIIPPGNVIFSTSNLDKRKYLPLSLIDTTTRIPLYWNKIYNYICTSNEIPGAHTAE